MRIHKQQPLSINIKVLDKEQEAKHHLNWSQNKNSLLLLQNVELLKKGIFQFLSSEDTMIEVTCLSRLITKDLWIKLFGKLAQNNLIITIICQYSLMDLEKKSILIDSYQSLGAMIYLKKVVPKFCLLFHNWLFQLKLL